MYLGMYVHTHWAYKHPYAARTWTLEDWRGYASGLRALGYNMMMIWPVTDAMPEALTPSDVAQLEMLRAIIDMLHDEFGMAVLITFGPNCLGSEAAERFTFTERPFFDCELRLNPSDPRELARLLSFRRRLITDYFSRADGFAIIDSDPGGCIGSTNAEFVNLLLAHLAIINDVNPDATLYYWMWMGWERYNRYRAWVQDLPMPEERSIESNFTEVLDGLLEHPKRRWAVLSCNGNHHPLIARYGIGDRALYNPYNLVEYEPSVPMTNYTPAALQEGLALPERQSMHLGTLANAQTHVAQLPHTFLFAHLAQGGTLDDADIAAFADGLLPGAGSALVEAWEAIGGTDMARMRRAAFAVTALAGEAFIPGPHAGLLFGDPRRYLDDLATMLRFRADLFTVVNAVRDGADWVPSLRTLHATWTAWTARTGYEDAFQGPVDDIVYATLQALDQPALTPVLADLHDWKKVALRHGIIRRLLAAIGEVIPGA
jgi:hypothetical protein